MFSLKQFSVKEFCILAAVIFIAVSPVAAQNSQREMTVEESYLQESIENMIIRESARAESREQKLIALEYIGEAIDRGNTSEEIYETLVFLTREGRRTVARESGRIVNNFPDVRRRAAIYLGQIGTEESAAALIDILQIENEPMVIQEAIKSLGDIGINNNNETIDNIVWVVMKFHNTNPDNLMALAAIDAIEKISQANDGISSAGAIQLLIRISEGPYNRPVRERARQAIADLRKFSE